MTPCLFETAKRYFMHVCHCGLAWDFVKQLVNVSLGTSSWPWMQITCFTKLRFPAGKFGSFKYALPP